MSGFAPKAGILLTQTQEEGAAPAPRAASTLTAHPPHHPIHTNNKN